MKALSEMKKTDLIEEIQHLDAVVGLLTAICCLHGEDFSANIKEWAIKQCKQPSIKGTLAIDLVKEIMERKP